ncbi:DMT family transporter [uncultured Lentibacter sp.]|jgi:drug/metabolite transporter (DMT)-like permease|uniref:DMT family transporter n=1 Tax=uncultured Lentibacter sp. TaxID=1659309 RepID=UPI0026115D6B|nr:DMT family transporter [uncultured Lentibacter sp.]
MSSPTKAILLMIAAIFCFSSMDMMAKLLAERVGTLTTLWVRYTGQALLVTALILPDFRRIMRTSYPKLQLARSVCLLGATGFFFFGISNIGLAQAASVMSTNPVFITLGAAFFLGERFGLRRAAAILAAFGGAYLVIRPGSAVFSPYALLPLAAAMCYSAYALVTRFVGRDEDAWTSLFYTALFGAAVLTLSLPLYGQKLGLSDVPLMVGITLCATLGQLALIRALMAGEAAMLAPFSYAGILFALVYGFFVFSAVPDLYTLIGALVIAASGIYVWHRETYAKPKSKP